MPNFCQEIEYLVKRVKQLSIQGTAWNEMAILYRSKSMGQQICQQFEQAQLPLEWINRDRNSRNYDVNAPSIKLLTMHSSKGLEFSVVFIPGVGFLPNWQSTLEEEARLLYVAMTRTCDQLILTCDRHSQFVTKLETALKRVRE